MPMQRDAENWMGKNEEILRNKTLRDICILGSHDAAMSELTKTFGLAHIDESAVLTQSHGFAKQLEYGARYFDIRPASWEHKDSKRTHHTSEAVGQAVSGGFGIGMDAIKTALTNFLARNPKEIIILCISHFACFKDSGLFIDKVTLTESDWIKLEEFLNTLPRLAKKSIVPNPLDTPFEEFWAKNVNVILHCPGGRAISETHDLKVYDRYSDTKKFEDMQRDQFHKYNDFAGTGRNYFLLSWTLTQSIGNIIKEARKANAESRKIVQQAAKSPEKIPNALYIDNVGDNDNGVFQSCMDICDIVMNPKTDYQRYNGNLIRARGNLPVYFVINGTAMWVKNPQSFNAVFVQEAWNKIEDFDPAFIDAFPKGGDIDSPALLNGNTGKVYLIPSMNAKQRVKHWIVSPYVFDASGFDWDAIKNDGQADSYAGGADIEYCVPVNYQEFNGHLIRARGNTAVYFAINGVAKWIKDPQSFNAVFKEEAWNKIEEFEPAFIDAFPKGGDIDSPALLNGRTGKVYLTYLIHLTLSMNAKQMVKHWIVNPSVFDASCFNRDAIKNDEQADSYAGGSDIKYGK